MAGVGAGFFEVRSGEGVNVKLGGSINVLWVFTCKVMDSTLMVFQVGFVNGFPGSDCNVVYFVRYARVRVDGFAIGAGFVSLKGGERSDWFCIDCTAYGSGTFAWVSERALGGLNLVLALLVCGGMIQKIAFVNVTRKGGKEAGVVIVVVS